MKNTERDFVRKFIDEASSVVGCLYIWGGNGDLVWTPQGMKDTATLLGPNPYGPELAFDCVGLVKWACKKAGGPDLLATHNAQTLFDELKKPDWTSPQLLFYGKDALNITHIAAHIGQYGDSALVLEAAGGGHLNTSWALSHAGGAKVRFGRAMRRDLVGSAPLSGLLYVGKHE